MMWHKSYVYDHLEYKSQRAGQRLKMERKQKTLRIRHRSVCLEHLLKKKKSVHTLSKEEDVSTPFKKLMAQGRGYLPHINPRKRPLQLLWVFGLLEELP